VPEVRKVMSLKRKGDFLMHGVVLQSRVFRAAARETAADVSRETFLRKTAAGEFPRPRENPKNRPNPAD
jgi:hypothetical protein